MDSSQYPGLGQLARLDRAQVVHVEQASGDGLPIALGDECAAGGALLQSHEAGVFERTQRLAQGIARHAELLGQRAFGRQAAAHAQVALRQFGADLFGDFLERARRADGPEGRGRGGVGGGRRGIRVGHGGQSETQSETDAVNDRTKKAHVPRISTCPGLGRSGRPAIKKSRNILGPATWMGRSTPPLGGPVWPLAREVRQ